MSESHGLRLYAYSCRDRLPEFVWAPDGEGADAVYAALLAWECRAADRRESTREPLDGHGLRPAKSWPHVEAGSKNLRLADRVLARRDRERLEVFVAWQNASLTEEQTCRLCGTDPVGVREEMLEAVESAVTRWRRLRSCAPPSPGSAGSNFPAPSSSGDPSGSGTTP